MAPMLTELIFHLQQQLRRKHEIKDTWDLLDGEISANHPSHYQKKKISAHAISHR